MQVNPMESASISVAKMSLYYVKSTAIRMLLRLNVILISSVRRGGATLWNRGFITGSYFGSSLYPLQHSPFLALILGYGLQRVEESANAIDRADVVILHANRLSKLIVDEETGLRGFLLTRNPAFLEPMHSADLQIEPEFDTLFTLVHRPDQVARLHRLQASP